MGGGISSTNTSSVLAVHTPVEIPLLKLPDALDEAIYVHEKFALVIDPSEQAHRYLKYQPGAYFNANDPIYTNTTALHKSLISSIQLGRNLILCINSFDDFKPETLFNPASFPIEVLDRNTFLSPEVWRKIINPATGDPNNDDIDMSSQFAVILCTSSTQIPTYLESRMHIIRIGTGNTTKSSTSASTPDDEIEQLYNAKEIIRNSTEMVEAAFDGELEMVKALIAKGYHIESCDGRKHTSLSEAAGQGHIELVQYLLDQGADPNALSDTNRSPLWRAAFNSHGAVMQVLLEAGSNPEFRDKVSMEDAFDVASSDECREILRNWDMARTVELMAAREKVIREQFEARLKSSSEREAYAKNLLRLELVSKATAGDMDGVKVLLETALEEALVSGTPPRVVAESRNDQGQSALSIAAQNDDEALARMLLTHVKTYESSQEYLNEDDERVKINRKVFNSKPNSRDLKGWTCVCVAVFHNSLRVLRLLLEHGGDPTIKSSYNKNAWDLAKDELDAAGHVMKSKAEVRGVLLEFFSEGDGIRVVRDGSTRLYEGLSDAGSAMVMNIEMNQEVSNALKTGASKQGSKSKHGGSKGKQSKVSGGGAVKKK